MTWSQAHRLPDITISRSVLAGQMAVSAKTRAIPGLSSGLSSSDLALLSKPENEDCRATYRNREYHELWLPDIQARRPSLKKTGYGPSRRNGCKRALRGTARPHHWVRLPGRGSD